MGWKARQGLLAGWVSGMALLCVSAPVLADTYPLPPEGEAVVGQPEEVLATHDDTLIDLARRHGLGFEEIVNANPGVDPWLPGEGTRIRLPKRRILPDAPREGIVINLAEHRLYYYPAAKATEPRVVISYPVSVGKMDWATPIGLTRIAMKIRNPTWTPPESVRQQGPMLRAPGQQQHRRHLRAPPAGRRC